MGKSRAVNRGFPGKWAFGLGQGERGGRRNLVGVSLTNYKGPATNSSAKRRTSYHRSPAATLRNAALSTFTDAATTKNTYKSDRPLQLGAQHSRTINALIFWNDSRNICAKTIETFKTRHWTHTTTHRPSMTQHQILLPWSQLARLVSQNVGTLRPLLNSHAFTRFTQPLGISLRRNLAILLPHALQTYDDLPSQSRLSTASALASFLETRMGAYSYINEKPSSRTRLARLVGGNTLQPSSTAFLNRPAKLTPGILGRLARILGIQNGAQQPFSKNRAVSFFLDNQIRCDHRADELDQFVKATQRSSPQAMSMTSSAQPTRSNKPRTSSDTSGTPSR